MKNFVAIGLACCIPLGLSAEDPSEAFLGTVNVLVIEESVPLAKDVLCAGVGERSECMAFNRAVLTVRIQKVSALHERGRWL
jgi:hypothetical protein